MTDCLRKEVLIVCDIDFNITTVLLLFYVIFQQTFQQALVLNYLLKNILLLQTIRAWRYPYCSLLGQLSCFISHSTNYVFMYFARVENNRPSIKFLLQKILEDDLLIIINILTRTSYPTRNSSNPSRSIPNIKIVDFQTGFNLWIRLYSRTDVIKQLIYCGLKLYNFEYLLYTYFLYLLVIF